jgi:hypothetical protein
MSEENTPPADPPVAVPPNDPATKPNEEPAWLPGRLNQAARSAETKLFAQYKVKDATELESKLKRLDELENERLSESERTQKLLGELKPKAERAAQVEALLGSLVESQFSALPEATRTAIDAVANGNPEERLKLMRVVQAAGLAAPGAPVVPPAPVRPPPANTAPPANPPPPAGVRSRFDEYQAITNPIQRGIFYQLNAAEIEQTRPA